MNNRPAVAKNRQQHVGLPAQTASHQKWRLLHLPHRRKSLGQRREITTAIKRRANLHRFRSAQAHGGLLDGAFQKFKLPLTATDAIITALSSVDGAESHVPDVDRNQS